MKNITIVIFIISLNLAHGQNLMDFSDTTNFSIMPRYDTLDLNPSDQYTDSLTLDLDCDHFTDVWIDCYKSPINYFPSANNIEIQNLLGSDFEMIVDGSLLQAFRNGDTVDLQDETVWESRSSFRILYFDVLGGPNWAGFYENHMYVVFRKKIGAEYGYGWIKYSGSPSPTFLYVEEIAYSNQFKTTNSVQIKNDFGIRIFPNPVEDYLEIALSGKRQKTYEWQIYNMNGGLIDSGIFKSEFNELNLSERSISSGMYIITIVNNGRLIARQKLIKT